ncbi:hypothetical protein BYT27DRAFT_7209418 [Phlegmacium glaucopus]|nr:hypothetical protein BYT27DRAFT_7209418 [Phlegmacium glaucopus]
MAAVAPPGPTQPPPTQNDIPGALNTISWEGDRMFNIYIYDYCYKRGFRKTARELLSEADIAPDATPPIDARQGLLFEWWSVFWVLFQAKSGGGSDDALVFTQHQAAQRLASQRLQPPGALTSASIHPGSQPTQPPLQSQQQQQGQPMGRFVNGIPRPGSTYLTNGPTPNGIITGMPHLQPGVSFSVGPPLPSTQPQQPNGIPGGPGGPQQPPPPPGGLNSGTQPMPFNSLMPGQPQQQRQPPPLMNGHPQQQQPQQRGPTNNGPFQSPTMANSPQNNNVGTPGHSGQPGPSNQPQQGQPPIGQFGGPSPNMTHAHMSRTMLPPNGGVPIMNPMGSGPQQQLTQQPGAPPLPGYSQQQQQQQGGRPPSRTNTPGGMMHSSPSLTPRQPDGMNGGAASENNINNEVMHIPQVLLISLKREIGLADKDLASLTTVEKNRILYAYRNRAGHGGPPPGNRNPNQKPGQQDNNAAAGPSTGIMQAPGQQGQRGPPQQAQHPQPRNKRNSTSPGEEHETLPRNESSPPERKRIRRSPAEQQPVVQQPISYPHHPQQQQQQQGQGQQPPQQLQQQNLPPQQQQQNQPGQPTQLQMQHQQMMMMRQMGLNGPPPLTGPVTQPQIGPSANPLMNNPLLMHGAPGMHMYRQRMNAGNPQVGEPVFNPTGGPPGVGGGPGPQFNPGGLNRIGQNKPGIGGSMMPPPSPAMNGTPKDSNGKDVKGLGPGGNNPGSPRNQQPPPNAGGGGGGTAPPTPVPISQPNPQQQQQQLSNQNSLNPSPATMMGVVPTSSGPGGGLTSGGNSLGGPQPDLNTMFNPEFMSNMTSSLEDFAGADLFRTTGPDGDINFERDFGQWFINPDDVGAGLDMK